MGAQQNAERKVSAVDVTRAEQVEAHGGGMLQANNLYYWVGGTQLPRMHRLFPVFLHARLAHL